MADRITYEQLRIGCRFTFLTIHKCSIQEKYGEHTRAEVSGIVKGEDVKKVTLVRKDILSHTVINMCSARILRYKFCCFPVNCDR